MCNDLEKREKWESMLDFLSLLWQWACFFPPISVQSSSIKSPLFRLEIAGGREGGLVGF